MSARLAGRVALLAGAAGGVGRAQAVRLAAEGADLLLLDRVSVSETVRVVEASGRRALALEMDTGDKGALDAAIGDGVGSLGRLDIVCVTPGPASAGPKIAGAVLDLPIEEWESLLEDTLTSAWKTCSAAIPHLLGPHGDGGSIVLTTPGSGRPGATGHLAAVEHGLLGLMRTLATELAQHDVRVNAVTPCGPGDADQQDNDGVAESTLFLASEAGRHLTGVALPLTRTSSRKRESA